MIVCSCNVISDQVLRDAASDLAREPACGHPTPGAVFRRVGCRPRCGGCFPLVKDIVAAARDALPPCALEHGACAQGGHGHAESVRMVEQVRAAVPDYSRAVA